MNQAPCQPSRQGACPGSCSPRPNPFAGPARSVGESAAPFHSPQCPGGRLAGPGIHLLSGTVDPEMKKRIPLYPLFSHLGSRSKKAVTSGYRFCTHHASPLHSGRNCSLVGLLTHTSRRLCRQRISPAFPAQASDPLSRKEDTLRAYSYVPIRTERSWAVFRNFT